MRPENTNALIAGIANYVCVSRGFGSRVDHETVFEEGLIRPLWDIGFFAGPDIHSLRTTRAGYEALIEAGGGTCARTRHTAAGRREAATSPAADDEAHHRCFLCGAYFDECQCDGGHA
ncbi:MAG: hypothetical protein WCF85_15500 [Rhodospirillaceae bacterium]